MAARRRGVRRRRPRDAPLGVAAHPAAVPLGPALGERVGALVPGVAAVTLNVPVFFLFLLLFDRSARNADEFLAKETTFFQHIMKT